MKKDNVVTLVSYKIRKGINHHNREIFDYMAELPEDEQYRAMLHFYDHIDHDALERQFGPFTFSGKEPDRRENRQPPSGSSAQPGQDESHDGSIH